MAATSCQVLALIPARSGSKGIPDKNIRPFLGKPLMAHSIEQALQCGLVNRTIVSTDSEQYAAIARQFGAEVLFLRPPEISGDLSTDLEVFRHALDWLRRHEGYAPDICLHLRPTHPIRRQDDVRNVLRLLMDDPELDSVRSVVRAEETPFKMWFRGADARLRPIVATEIPEAHSLPRQALPPAYLQNAAIDAVRTRVILENCSMTGSAIHGYLMDESFDIDTESDFVRAQAAEMEVALEGRKTFCFDIDGVLATQQQPDRYQDAQPIAPNIELARRLHAMGHRIILFTARGSATGLDWRELTNDQMRRWGVEYSELRFGKPAADFYVDDKALLPAQLKQALDRRSDSEETGE